MAKIFQTISLEERWKNSIHNRAPLPPAEIKQEIPNLKTTPKAKEKTGSLLKAMIASKDRVIPTIQPLITTPLSTLATPLPRKQFRSNISLANRLEQSKLGTTNHLPQFYLSDFYTDYITVVPFGVFTHTSNTVIPLFGTFNHTSNILLDSPKTIFDNTLTQGVQSIAGAVSSIANIIVPSYDSLLLQGTAISNGVYQSFTNITFPILDILQSQGATLNNLGIYQSFVIPDISVAPNQLIVFPPIQLETIASLTGIALLQGMYADAFGTLFSFTEPVEPIAIPVTIPSSIVVLTSGPTPDQGGTNPTPITFQPDRTTPVLNVLVYTADRALSLFAPTVKHGSSLLSPTETTPGYFQRESGILFAVEKFAELQALRDLMVLGDAAGQTSKDLFPTYQAAVYGDDKKHVKYFTNLIGWSKTAFSTYNANTAAAYTLGHSLKSDDRNEQLTALLATTEIDNLAVQDPNQPSTQLKSLGGYATLTYDKIRERAQGKSNNNDFRGDLTVPNNLRLGTGTTPQSANRSVFPIITSPNFNDAGGLKAQSTSDQVKRSTSEYSTLGYDELATRANANPTNPFVKPSEAAKDTVIIRVAGIQFRAFLTSFSDGLTINWTDYKYVGKQDTLKMYNGTTRGVSLGFKVASYNQAELTSNLANIEKLVETAGYGKPSGKYILSPATSITVGKWLSNAPCVLNSIKFDIQTADYSWDINKGLPHVFDVSIDAALLGNASGKSVNSGPYFG